MPAIFWIIVAVLAVNAVLTSVLMWAVNSKQYSKYRLRVPTKQRIPPSKKYLNAGLNGILSVVFITFLIYYFGDSLYHKETDSAWVMIYEFFATLLLYDFMYYFLHRAMHIPKAMKFVHGVHHYVRFPTAIESTYLHPAENFAGLGLLFIAMAIVGPVSLTSFAAIFLVYTTMNVIVHCNLVFPHPAFTFFNFIVKKHDIHHGKHLNRNYSSLTPFWDYMFGTYA